MKRLRMMLAFLPALALLWMLALAACTSGNLGSEEIAFVRDGNLWTIDPSGANAFEAVAQSTPVLGYGFSPDHRIFVFRTLDSTFAQTAAGKRLSVNPITGLAGDTPGTLNTVGIDGGTPIPIIISGSTLTQSNAWWSPGGTRLLYREGADPSASPYLAAWWISQDDQPMGIARKPLQNSFSIPSINTASSLAIGNSAQGIFTTTLAGTNLSFVQRDILPGHPLAATLERILWQPAHTQPALLYAISPPTQTHEPGQFTLLLRLASGKIHLLANCTCRQFAWSPDGNRVLYSTDQGYTVLNIQDTTSFQFTAEHGAVPYWSPDSRSLLLDGLHTLTLVHMATQQVQVLLNDGSTPMMTDGPLPGRTAVVQPVANSQWNVDGRRFVLTTRGRTQWLGQQLNTGNGLYTVTLNSQGEPQGAPTLVDNNRHDTQPGWSYEDPNTSFLF